MMGTAAVNVHAPITKLTSGILLFTDDISFKPEETVCIRCGKCIEACPVGLMPFAIAAQVRDGDYHEMKKLHVLDCIECGSCAYICPARIPLLDCCKLGKYELKKSK